MEWQAQAKQLADTLRLSVRSVGVCLLTLEESESEKALRPGRDLGRKFTYCQALSAAGRMGLPVMVSGEDEGCIMILPAFGMGRFDPPEKIPQSQCAMGWIKDEETAVMFVMGQAEDIVEPGAYAALYAVPLELMPRRPEVVVVCRALARVEDHEMAFSFTLDHMDAILEGIEEVGKRSGLSWPMKYVLYDTDFTQMNPVYAEYVQYLERL